MLHGQVAFDRPADSQADGAGFLGNDDRDGIGLFGHADPGAVPGAELSREHRIHGERQKARRGCDAVFLHDHGAIVQRSAGTKNRGQQIVGKMRVERNAALDVGAQPDLPLDHNQGAGLVLGKQVGGKYDVIVSVGL